MCKPANPAASKKPTLRETERQGKRTARTRAQQARLSPARLSGVRAKASSAAYAVLVAGLSVAALLLGFALGASDSLVLQGVVPMLEVAKYSLLSVVPFSAVVGISTLVFGRWLTKFEFAVWLAIMAVLPIGAGLAFGWF